jgi:lipopolysaccharide export system permease protein
VKIIDKYILTAFLKNFLFGMLCFILIFILVDMFENIDKFIDKKLTPDLIIKYYCYFIPEIVKLITPVSMLLATLFTSSRFISLSEMTAINSAGISIYRFSLPLLLTGIVVTIFSIYFNGWIVPYSNTEKLAIEREKIGKNKNAGIIPNLSLQDSENQILTIKNYNELEKSGEFASIQIFSNNELSDLTERYDARKINWDSIAKRWTLTQVTYRTFDSANLSSYKFIGTVSSNALENNHQINITPERINIKRRSPDELILTELRSLIDQMKYSGQDVTRAEVDYYSKISFPFANIIVIIFGVSLSLNQRKGSAAVQFGISILVTFIYLGFIKISQTFGYNGEIDPMLTAWTANILFLLLGILNLLRLNLKS